MPIQWTTDSKGNRTATWVDDEPAAPKAQDKPAQGGVSVPGSGLLDVITKDAPTLIKSSAQGLTQGVQTLQRTGDPVQALGAAGRAYMDVLEGAENPIPRVVLSGARGLAQNVLGNTPADIGSLLTGKPRMQNAGDAKLLGVLPPLPKVKLQGPGEELASNIVQFGLGWFPAARAVSWTGQALAKIPAVATGVQAARTTAAFAKGNKAAGAALKAGEIAGKGAITGSVVDFAGMDVEDGRLTDVVVQLNPTIRKFTQQTIGTPLEIPYLEYLQSKPGDTAANARWKNAVEGNFFVGPAFEAVIWATGRFARASSQYLKTLGQPKAAAEAVVDVAAEAVPTQAAKTGAAAAPPTPQVAAEVEQATINRVNVKGQLDALGPEPELPLKGEKGTARSRQHAAWVRERNKLTKELEKADKGLLQAQNKSLEDQLKATPKASKAEVAEAEAELKEAAQTLQDALAKTAQPEAAPVAQAVAPPAAPVARAAADVPPAAAAPAAVPGRPLVKAGAELSHGTSEAGRKGILADGFRTSEYERSGTVAGDGVYMTPSERYAKEYGQKTVGGTLPDDAKILDWTGSNQTLADLADEIGIPGPRKLNKSAGEVELDQAQQQALKQWALDNGYDGIQYRTNFTPEGKATEVVIYNTDLANRLVGSKAAPAAAAPEPSVPSAGSSAPAAGPTPQEIRELDDLLAKARADLTPDQRIALRDETLAQKYGTGSAGEPPVAQGATADAMPSPAPASVMDEGGVPPRPPAEPPRFTDPDSPEWAVRFAEQVAANLDNIKAGRVSIDDLLANNFQKFQSPSGNTQYVAKQPELVAGYDAMSQVLPERDVLSGIPTFNKQELTQLNQDWFYRHGADGDAILKGLAPLIKGFEEYQLGALHRAMVLADKKNLEAAMEGAMWINSGAFSGVNVSERLARLVEAAAAAKRVNLAVMKVTRPWGQLGLEMQMDRNLVVPKKGDLDAPLVDIAAELRKSLQEGDSETLEETLLGRFHPDLADAARGGEITPEAQSAADALAEVLQDIHAEKKAAPRFWEGLDEMPASSATEAFLAMRTNNLISSGITMNTNLLNGLINMPVLTAQQVFGRGLKGDWRGALNDIGQFQRFFLQLESGFRMFGHSFKAGRSLTNMDSSTVDFLGKAAKQDAIGEAALEPKRSSSMINSFPLVSEEMANTRMGQMADWMWRVLGTPFSRMAVSIDTFNSTVAGYAYEHTRHMGRGMELAIERGMKENSSEAWKWANQYAEARVKESVKNVVIDGRTLGEAALTSPHAKTFMDAVNFTDKLMTELQPRTMAEGVRLGELEGLKGDDLQAFAENYIKEGTNMQKMAKLMLEGPVPLGRVGSIPGAAMTALAKAKYVGPVFRFVQPFITVPNNIMKTMARNTLAAPLVDTWWRDMASEDPGTKARALGQFTSGSLFAGFVALQVSLGNVRINGGGPIDPRAREEWQNVQKRVPYSIQLPDGQGGWSTPVSMRAFEPFSTLFGAIGDYTDMAGSLSDVEREKLGGALVLTLMQLQASNLLSKTYFQGANELYEAIFGVGQNDTGTRALERMQRYIARNVVAAMVPGISFLRAGRRAVDPLARTTDVVDPDQVGGIVQSIFYQALDEVRISVPGQSEEYPARLHPITGRPIVLSGIWGTEFIPEDQPWMAALAQLAPWSPLQVGEKNIDPVDMEMGRLSELGARFSLPQASDFGAGTRLTRTQLNQYIDTFSSVRVMGRTVHDRLLEAIQSEAYRSWPYETKEAGVPGLRSGYLQEIVSEYKEVAKQQFLNTSAVGAQIQRQKAEVKRRKDVQDFTRSYGGSTAPRQPERMN
jgi:hypothetical protein